MEKGSIIQELEDFELEILNNILNNSSFFKEFYNVSEDISEDLVNYLLIKNENNLVFNVHNYIITNLISLYFSKINFEEEYHNYLCCFKNQDFFKYVPFNFKEIFGYINKDFIIEILELLHISFLNSQIEYNSGEFIRKTSKINLVERGAVYTQENIANKITTKTIDNQLNKNFNKYDLTILDFGCATGRFYINAFDYLVNNLKLNAREVISHNLFGIDIDSIAIDILRIKIFDKLEDPELDDLIVLSQNILCKNMLFDKNELISSENAIDFDNDFVNLDSSKGFNIILSNPPYFLLKINKKGKNKLFKEYYDSLKNKINEELNYFRNSGAYSYSIEGMLNYYKLSIERMIKIASDDAEIGVICPSTIFADLSSKKLRTWMVSEHKLRELQYFAESDKLFNNVSQSTVIFYLNKNNVTDDILVNINNSSFNISLDLIKRIFGEKYEIAYIDKIGWNILDKLSNFKKIKEHEFIRNKRGEFDLTINKEFITDENTGWRLVRGNMLKPEGIIDSNKEYVYIKEFLNKKSDVYKNNDFAKKRLACHQISNIDKIKRLNFVECNSKDILANSCNYIYFDEELFDLDIEESILKLKYILNSYLLNWRFKITSSNNHINNYELDELPLLDLNEVPLFDGLNSLETNILICKLYGLNRTETIYILKNFYEIENINEKWGDKLKIYNHLAPGFSDLEWQMVEHIPEGGNWKNIPKSVPSKRLEQIRKSGGRTTYYGRLRRDTPSYTISTYFNRLGNGCYIHPTQDRLISLREGARLQSFKDSFFFCGPKTSIYKQIGNAVPPLLGRAVANLIKPYLKNKNYLDLFCGAGGLSEGFKMEDYNLVGSIEFVNHFFSTFEHNHILNNNGHFVLGDITEEENRKKLISVKEEYGIGAIIGGPPCQGFSTAGCRDPNDERNQLFKYFVDCVDKINPEMFVMENVPGILSMQKGAVIEEIKNSFEEIGYYVSEPFKLNAEEFGVPQKRKRVFIIGSLKKINVKEPKPLFSETNSNLPNPITVQEAIGNLPPLKAGEGSMEIEITGKLEGSCPYQKFMIGEYSFEEFYKHSSKQQTLF